MKNKRLGDWVINLVSWVFVGLLGLVGCHSTTSSKTEAKAAEKAAAAAPVATVEVGRPLVGYHHYRGTVGGQSVTVELTIEQTANANDSTRCFGSYTYDRHPAGRLLLHGGHPFSAQLPLKLIETDTAHHQSKSTGYWQANQPVGALLTGTWRSPAGQQLPFSLHEDYANSQAYVVAVQYELLQEGEEAPTPSERQPGESKAAYRARTEDLTNSSSRFFLHLLGPDTLRTELRALQCPVPAERRRLLREYLGYPGIELRDELTVAYNDHGLLSLASFYERDFKDAPHPEQGAGATTYDLRTGRMLTIAELIRPGTDTILSRLITQHLEQDEHSTAEELFDSTRAPLPLQGLGIEEEGLIFTYTTGEVQPVNPPTTMHVPWAELLPLLRPDSPVARMLRERGLWRNSRNKSR